MAYRYSRRLGYVLSLLVVGIGAVAARAQDAGEGEQLFRQRCASCHALQAGQNRIGPHLAGILGRPAASVAGARYSNALRAAGVVWDEQTLDRFLADPRRLVPGTTMTIGVPAEGPRRALIAFLRGIN